MDLTKLSVIELKAMAFDQVKLLEQTRVNIQILEKELSVRSQVVAVPVAVPKAE